MTRREYTDRVLSGLRRLTGPEREAVRAELDAHMEDHICDLLDLGYDEELAEERTMQRMGDPAEVSRELNKQYPLRWLVLGILAKAAAVWLVLMLVFFTIADDGTGLLLSWKLRLWPQTVTYAYEASAVLDARLQIGNDVVRLKQITVERDEEDGLVARLRAGGYDKNPIGIVGGPDLYLENQRGEQAGTMAVARGDWYCYYDVRVSIRPEDDYVTVSCCRYGQAASCRIALPEVSP